MKTVVLGVSQGRFTVNAGSGPEENGSFALDDVAGATLFLLPYIPKGHFLCSSSCDFPQDDGAPPGWKFDTFWNAIHMEALQLCEKEDVVKNLRAWASKAHGDQKYGSKPYIYHLDATYAVAVRYNLDEEQRIAAYLHDILEDTKLTYTDLAAVFPKGVCDLVEAVTGRGKDRKERNADAHRKIVLHGPRAAQLKLCDRIANAKESRLQAYSTPSVRRNFDLYRAELEDFETMILEATEGREGIQMDENGPIWPRMLGELFGLLA